MKTILATVALMAGQAAAGGRRLALTDGQLGTNNAGDHQLGNYALKPETCADGSAADKVIYRSIYDQYRVADTDAKKQAAMDECYDTADTWCQGKAECTGLTTSTTATVYNLKPITSGALIGDYTGQALDSLNEDVDVPFGCVALRNFYPATQSGTGLYQVFLNSNQWSNNKNVGYLLDKTTHTYNDLERHTYSMDREYVKRTCPIVARQFRRFEAFKDFDIRKRPLSNPIWGGGIFTHGGEEHQMGCVIRPIGNSDIYYDKTGVGRTLSTSSDNFRNTIYWGFYWKNDGNDRTTQGVCDTTLSTTGNKCGLLEPQTVAQSRADGKFDADVSKQFTAEPTGNTDPEDYKVFYPHNNQEETASTTGIMSKRGWFTIPARGSGGMLGCDHESSSTETVATALAYCNTVSPSFMNSGNPDIAGQSPNPKMLYPDFGCESCTPIQRSVANSFTCTDSTDSVFNTPINDGQCTESDEAPYTATPPHICGPMGNGCPAGFKQKTASCTNCLHARTNSSFINIAACRDDTGVNDAWYWREDDNTYTPSVLLEKLQKMVGSDGFLGIKQLLSASNILHTISREALYTHMVTSIVDNLWDYLQKGDMTQSITKPTLTNAMPQPSAPVTEDVILSTYEILEQLAQIVSQSTSTSTQKDLQNVFSSEKYKSLRALLYNCNAITFIHSKLGGSRFRSRRD